MDGTRGAPLDARVTRRTSLRLLSAAAAGAVLPGWAHAWSAAPRRQPPTPRSRMLQVNGLRLHALDWGE